MPAGTFRLVRRAGAAPRVVTGPKHDHPGFELTWLAAGKLEFELEGAALTASSGTCVLMPPRVVSTPRWRTRAIHQVLIAPDLVAEAADAIGGRVPTEPCLLDHESSVSSVARAIAIESPAGEQDPTVEALVQALILAIVRRRSDTERTMEPGIRRALSYLTEHYADVVRVDDLARIAGMSRFVFLRKFAGQVGQSPYRYLTSVRLDRAAERLSHGSDSVLEIALGSGFGDPSRFARAFARKFGCTPRTFRARSA